MERFRRFVRNVIKENYKSKFEGCYFKKLGTNIEGKSIYLVMSNLGDELGLCAKLALNNSSLQSDYEYDWNDLASSGEYVGWSEENIDSTYKTYKTFNFDNFFQSIENGFKFARKFNLD